MKNKYPAPFDLSGKVALVTGAASGLGAVFCEAMADAAADVVCADRDVAGLTRTAVAVEKAGSRALVVGCDVTDEVAVDDMVARTVATFGTLDIIFNNAGIADAEPALIHESATKNWNDVLAVDLNGVFFRCRAPIPAYAAAKGAVVNLARELGLQYAPHNIQVNAICPEFYRSRLGPYDDPDFVAAITAFTPAGPIAEASEIKGTAIYLASAASDFLSGSLIVADGGCLAK